MKFNLMVGLGAVSIAEETAKLEKDVSNTYEHRHINRNIERCTISANDKNKNKNLNIR